MPWDAEMANPVAAIAQARCDHGDTFVVESGGDRYLFTFSPVGVASFYALEESDASKGVADWRMLRRKIPDEVFQGRRTFPHELFTRDDAASHLLGLEKALDATLDELGDEGEIDVFVLTRRLGHRMGLAAWGGAGASDGPLFERLVADFDALDGSESFVHPAAMRAVADSGYEAERAALDDIVGAVAEMPADPGTLFERMAERWAGEPEPARTIGLAYDFALVHIASMSNLFAALGWSLVDLIEHPDEAERAAAGDRARTELCVLESARLAQRSIMSRFVLQPVALDDGHTTYSVPPGVTIATLLPVTNTSAAPGLEEWDPHHWNRRRLADPGSLPAVELVTVFGHGKHTCPAQPFSLAAMTTALVRLLATYQLTAGWTEHPTPAPSQIGGVARAGGPCPLRYSRR